MSRDNHRKTFLLAWNPKRWRWANIDDMSAKVNNDEIIFDRWSSGVSKQARKGDRFFLIRLGEEPRGIFASGIIEEDSFEDLHWDEEKASAGETTNYVSIRYDTLINPETEPILSREVLNSSNLSEMHWDTQMSGIQIPDQISQELENVWASFKKSTIFSFPEEIETEQVEIFEGTVRRISINAYERNPEARRKCIEHYGAICSICQFDFKETYGEVGEGFIHVHHLKQISEIGETYKVDPIKDLRPVCPNCHAMIHKKQPPYMIEEIKRLLKK
jgi:5-methylcytosine-specific restriction protein A